MINSRIVEIDNVFSHIEIFDENDTVLETIPYLCDVSDIINKHNISATNKKIVEENILLKERVLQLEVAEVNRKSKEIEQQILGGTV